MDSAGSRFSTARRPPRRREARMPELHSLPCYAVFFECGAVVHIQAESAEAATAACGSLWNRLVNGNVVTRVELEPRFPWHVGRPAVVLTIPRELV